MNDTQGQECWGKQTRAKKHLSNDSEAKFPKEDNNDPLEKNISFLFEDLSLNNNFTPPKNKQMESRK